MRKWWPVVDGEVLAVLQQSRIRFHSEGSSDLGLAAQDDRVQYFRGRLQVSYAVLRRRVCNVGLLGELDSAAVWITQAKDFVYLKTVWLACVGAAVVIRPGGFATSLP